jgi:hypothetical protein
VAPPRSKSDRRSGILFGAGGFGEIFRLSRFKEDTRMKNVRMGRSCSISPITRRSGFALAALMFLCAVAQQARAVSATTTTLALTSGGVAASSVASGTAVTLTATVVSGTTPVTPGQVNFCDALATYCTDIHLRWTAQLTSAGTAALKFVPGPGTQNYKAIFVATNPYATSSSGVSTLTVTQTPPVGQYPTSTTITASGIPGDYTLTATVTGYTDRLGIAAPGPSITALSTVPLAPGPSGLTAVYSAYLATGRNPSSITSGDFNGDGKPRPRARRR